MLPLVAALVVGLGVTAAVDVSEEHVTVFTETIHLLEIAGFVALWRLSTLVRQPFADGYRAQATSS